jgi:hypothetical protein
MIEYENGLIKGLEYKFDSSGFIDWKSMIPQKFYFINKANFESRGQDVPEKLKM